MSIVTIKRRLLLAVCERTPFILLGYAYRETDPAREYPGRGGVRTHRSLASRGLARHPDARAAQCAQRICMADSAPDSGGTWRAVAASQAVTAAARHGIL